MLGRLAGKKRGEKILLSTLLPLLFFSLPLGFLSCTLLCTFFSGCYSRNDVVKRIVDNSNGLDLGRAVKTSVQLGSGREKR
jgi:hypothetical protein